MPEALEWVVTLSADGVEAVIAEAKKVADSVQEQEKATERVRTKSRAYHDQIRQTQREIARMNRGIKDGTLPHLLKVTRQAEKLKQQMRDALVPPQRTRRAFQEDWVQQQQKNDRLRRGMADGSLRALERQRREFERLNREAARQIRIDEMRAKYGQVGAMYARNEHWMAPAGRLAGWGGAAAMAAGTAMVHKGFSGTVEAARFDAELSLASRELASAFKPALETATKGMRGFRRMLEAVPPIGQKAIGAIGSIAALNVGALALARVAGFTPASIISRLFASSATAVGSAAVGSAGVKAASSLAAGGSAAAGSAGTAAAATAPGLLASPFVLPGIAAAANVGAGAYSVYDTQERIRNEGWSIRKGLEMQLSASPLGGLIGAQKLLGRGINSVVNPSTGDSGGKSKVMLAGGGFEAMNTGYERAVAAAGMVDNSLEGDNAAKILGDIKRILEEQGRRSEGGVMRVPPPGA